MLLTGDARGDKILEGPRAASALLEPGRHDARGRAQGAAPRQRATISSTTSSSASPPITTSSPATASTATRSARRSKCCSTRAGRMRSTSISPIRSTRSTRRAKRIGRRNSRKRRSAAKRPARLAGGDRQPGRARQVGQIPTGSEAADRGSREARHRPAGSTRLLGAGSGSTKVPSVWCLRRQVLSSESTALPRGREPAAAVFFAHGSAHRRSRIRKTRRRRRRRGDVSPHPRVADGVAPIDQPLLRRRQATPSTASGSRRAPSSDPAGTAARRRRRTPRCRCECPSTSPLRMPALNESIT